MDIIVGRSLLRVPDPVLEIEKKLILEKLEMNNLTKDIKYKANRANISVEEQLIKDLYLEKTLTKIEVDDIKIQLKTLSNANEYLLSELVKYKELYGELDNSN